MAILTKKRFTNLTPSDIAKMKSPELRELLRGARNLFTQQEAKFKRYEEKTYSPALGKMREYYDEVGGKKAVSKMNMNQMRSELFQLQDFFEAKTSTVPGARKVQSDMAKRVFGTDKRGRAKKNPGTSWWSNFWSLYDEYKKMRPADVFEKSSLVQQMLGQILIENNEMDFSARSLEQLADRLQEEKERFNWELDYDDEESPTVFSDTRPY